MENQNPSHKSLEPNPHPSPTSKAKAIRRRTIKESPQPFQKRTKLFSNIRKKISKHYQFLKINFNFAI